MIFEKIEVDGAMPTIVELEVLKGYTYGMSPEEIAISIDIPVLEVDQHMDDLCDKWHILEDMWGARFSR